MTSLVHDALPGERRSAPRRDEAVVPLRDRDRTGDTAEVREPISSQQYLPLLKFAVFNLAAFALVGGAYAQGWIATLYQADQTRLTVVIVAVFLAGLAVCAQKLWRISRELNCVRNFDPCRLSWATAYLAEVAGRSGSSRAIAGSSLRVRLANHIVAVRHFANSLVLLGLIGTVIGFIIALSGLDPKAAGDVEAIAPAVSELISGMSTALYTTLIGAVLNLWLMVDYHILVGGATKLATGLVALGEANARSGSA